MPSAQPDKCTAAVKSASTLTFGIPEGEVSIAGSFRGQGEEEVMSRLGLVSVYHTNGVNQLRRSSQKEKKQQKKSLDWNGTKS